MRELTQMELQEVNGGIDWDAVALGVGIIGLSIAIVGTAGLATIPVGLLGAATAGELIAAISAVGSSGVGGIVIGYGIASS